VKPFVLASLVIPVLLAVFRGQPTLQPDPPKECDDCADWNRPLAPFKVFGNTYYVGTDGLSALLVTDDAGLILLDGALPQSATLIDQNIRALGFRTENVRIIVNSHAHYDHAGGIAALQRFTQATVAASPAGTRALERGGPTEDDPQFGFGKSQLFPAVKGVRVVADGETLSVGKAAITAHFTPGHTPGATTCSWQSCEGSRCLNIVYADSISAVAAPGYRFTAGAPPTVADRFRESIAKVEKLPCDILFSTHPSASDMKGKLARRQTSPTPDPFVDSGSCRAYAAAAHKRLEERVAEESKGAPKG
jgi:metallo-beta-lactamase class B